jgi:hypothetical protein
MMQLLEFSSYWLDQFYIYFHPINNKLACSQIKHERPQLRGSVKILRYIYLSFLLISWGAWQSFLCVEGTTLIGPSQFVFETLGTPPIEAQRCFPVAPLYIVYTYESSTLANSMGAGKIPPSLPPTPKPKKEKNWALMAWVTQHPPAHHPKYSV